jgi:tetratricopeptide (TPR) repeat protein
MEGTRPGKLLGAVAAALFCSGTAVAGSPDAVALARAGRCEEALVLFEAAAQAPETDLLRTECLVRLRRHGEAAPLLEALVEREPALAEAWLYLGMARFHLGDAQGAEAALLLAEPDLGARPELRLYRGLARLALGDAAGAADFLEGISEGSAAPIAAYWAGVAWIRAGEPARGRDALRRVLALAPESAWAAQAEQALRGSAEPGRRWWIRTTAGYEYDDNVVLRAGDVPLAREISSQRDTRMMWRLEAGSEWWRREAWSAGSWLQYAGTDHDDLDSLDVHLPSVGLWLDRRFGPATTARLAYDFGWAFVDEDSFLQSHGLTASGFRSFGWLGTTQLFGRLYAYDYRVEDADVPDGRGVDFSLCPSPTALVCGGAGVDEESARDRDGYGTASGFLHSFRVDALRSEVWVGYTYFRYWAEGKEQSYSAHEARLGARTWLPLGLELRIDAAYAYRPYRHASSVPEPFVLFLNREYPTRDLRRRDEVARVEVGLERILAERVRIGVLYSYIDNESNLELFDYDRQIVGSYVTIGLGPGRWTR